MTKLTWSVVSRLTEALWKDISPSPSYLGPYSTWSRLNDFFALQIFAASFPVTSYWDYHFCWNNPLFLAKTQAQISVWFGGSNSFLPSLPSFLSLPSFPFLPSLPPFPSFLPPSLPSFHFSSGVGWQEEARVLFWSQKHSSSFSHYKANQPHKTSQQHPHLFYWKPINNRRGHGKPISAQSIQVSSYNSVSRG